MRSVTSKDPYESWGTDGRIANGICRIESRFELSRIGLSACKAVQPRILLHTLQRIDGGHRGGKIASGNLSSGDFPVLA